MSADGKEHWLELVDRYLRGEATDVEFTELKSVLRTDRRRREQYLDAVKLDSLLRDVAGKKRVPVGPANRRRSSWLVVGAGVAAGLVIATSMVMKSGDRNMASVAKVSDAIWQARAWSEGEALGSGDHLNLVSGSVEVRFVSGATTRIQGPSQFAVTSSNGGFLYHGEAFSRADTESSRGFVIETSSGRFVDQGTEFLTTANTDGFSQMHVASGKVDAEVDGFKVQRFGKGSGLGIEPGETPILIRIEPGEGTPAFSFPTIPPPSGADAADLSQGKCEVRLVGGGGEVGDVFPHVQSGSPRTVIDGRGQSGQDEPQESLFFKNGASGTILVDLGREVPITKIHTYSWHLSEIHPGMRRRAVQRFTLWGARGEMPEALPLNGEPQGWSRVARVDTDVFFGVDDEPDRPAQQACAIHSNGLPIGNFRYLLFEVFPTPMPEGIPSRHTFYGEIDVFSATR